jgi:hypothetical protein
VTLRLFVRRRLIEFTEGFFVGGPSGVGVVERRGLLRRCSGGEAQAFEDLARNCRIFDGRNEPKGGSAAGATQSIDVEYALGQSRPRFSLPMRDSSVVVRICERQGRAAENVVKTHRGRLTGAFRSGSSSPFPRADEKLASKLASTRLQTKTTPD